MSKFSKIKERLTCNKPVRSYKKDKKKMVLACEDGKEKLVHFGAEGYGHNYSKEARASFRARHNCDNPGSKLKARYWACKNLWAGPSGEKRQPPKNGPKK